MKIKKMLKYFDATATVVIEVYSVKHFTTVGKVLNSKELKEYKIVNGAALHGVLYLNALPSNAFKYIGHH